MLVTVCPTSNSTRSTRPELASTTAIRRLPSPPMMTATRSAPTSVHGIEVASLVFTNGLLPESASSNINWNRPARAVASNINGLWSWPTAACNFVSATGKGERVQLARARAADNTAPPPPELPPGAFRPDGAVQANPGSVQILEIKPAGGKHMPFDAFIRSRDIRPPARLLPIEVPA